MTQSAAACQGPQPSNLALFRQRLPRKPYHTDRFGDGLRIRDVQKALTSRYIQFNGPTHCYWLVYDIDRNGAVLDWYDRGAPPPTIVAQNPDNGHAHLIYGLEVPVRTAPDGKSGPLRYAAAVDCALRDILGADIGYAGLVCKNPLHPHWRVTEWETRLYTLGDLDSWLDLNSYSDRRKRLPDYGLGRNCTLFEKLRLWAYKAIRQGWPDADRWYEAVLTRARAYNDFESPLSENEVRATAKSVAKWTHRNLSDDGFRALQAERGRAGGKASRGGGRPLGKNLLKSDVYESVVTLKNSGMSNRSIAEKLGVSASTVFRYLQDRKNKGAP
ncbi:replication initiation protein (plasmid) [Cobetia amphilecti]|uniref:replication initiation protein n=1 Tax=Cobetia amphilecti TaxID=1055104 RepID=UPI002942578B|nr:replication initiation protein [Cobetia amphilecti]WOI27638.1 replication initiation protein [Cobetia amphilecti]WOI27643.1 replication initiation protein [Cobetia amphilecti]